MANTFLQLPSEFHSASSVEDCKIKTFGLYKLLLDGFYTALLKKQFSRDLSSYEVNKLQYATF
jgi:hypothetical protein